jgi:formylglycine-generating enzyme required for sulfatase activity
MTKDETLRLALEALEADPLEMVADVDGHMVFLKDKAITAIKEALAQPEQEPVAWGVFEGNLHDMFFSPSEAQEMADLKGTHAEVRPLYTTPPQREFVGLTYEEKHEIRYSHMTSAEFIEFIEAKLKEKNT